jgi:hypothetical protein
MDQMQLVKEFTLSFNDATSDILTAKKLMEDLRRFRGAG